MNSLDRKLVNELFREMVKHKPSLDKFLIVDDDNEIDVRELADAIIKAFPWPIGNELRRLFSGSMMNLDRGRLDQIFKIIERIFQFTSFVMISQLIEEVLKESIKIPTTYSNEFKRRFSTLTMGNFAWLIRSTGKLFLNYQITPFMKEMAELLNNSFFDSIDSWVKDRNDISHYQINLTEEEIEKRCVECEEKLTSVLIRLSFFIKYKLVTMREIEVIKHKRKPAMFKHTIDLLNSVGSEFKTRIEILDNFADSHSVLIIKDYKETEGFLNMSPFVIDTRSEILDSKEKFSIKKDIFLYSKYVKGRIHYVGTEVTEKCDLSLLSNYNDLNEEFKEVLITLCNGEFR